MFNNYKVKEELKALKELVDSDTEVTKEEIKRVIKEIVPTYKEG